MLCSKSCTFLSRINSSNRRYNADMAPRNQILRRFASLGFTWRDCRLSIKQAGLPRMWFLVALSGSSPVTGADTVLLTIHTLILHFLFCNIMARTILHCPLVQIHRQTKWSEYLQMFTFKWLYRPGKSNVADPPSRNPGVVAALLPVAVAWVQGNAPQQRNPTSGKSSSP